MVNTSSNWKLKLKMDGPKPCYLRASCSQGWKTQILGEGDSAGWQSEGGKPGLKWEGWWRGRWEKLKLWTRTCEALFPKPRAEVVCCTPRFISSRQKRGKTALWNKRDFSGRPVLFLPNPSQLPWSLLVIRQKPRKAHLECQDLSWSQAPWSSQGMIESISYHLAWHRKPADEHPLLGGEGQFLEQKGGGKGRTPGISSLPWHFSGPFWSQF